MHSRILSLAASLAFAVSARADVLPGNYNVYDFGAPGFTGGSLIGGYGSGRGIANITGSTSQVLMFGATLGPNTVTFNFASNILSSMSPVPLDGVQFIGDGVADNVSSITLDPSSTLLGIVPTFYIGTIGPNHYTYLNFDFTNANIQPGEVAKFNLGFGAAPTPEPSSLLFLATGLVGIAHKLKRGSA